MSRPSIAFLALLSASSAWGAEPAWLQEARARESRPVDASEFASKDGWFKGRVAGRVSGDIEKVEGSYTVTIDIGGEAPVYCEIVPEGFDLADMLRRTFELSIEVVAKEQGKVEATQLEFSDAGAVGGVPFLATRWLYRVNDGKESRLGGLKQAVFEKSGHGVYCAHADIGYVASFEGIYRAFAESLEVPAADPAPYYAEISVTSLGGTRVGVSWTTLVRDAEGDTKAEHVSAMVFPGPAGGLRSQDSRQLEWVTPDSALINAVHVVSSDGELTTNLRLGPRDDEWAVEGELQGKEVDLSLPAEQSPGSLMAQALALRKLLVAADPAGAEHVMPMWVAADPTRFTSVRTRLLEDRGDAGFAAHASIGGIEFDLVLEKATGMATSAEVPVGPQVVHLERVHQSGTF